MLTTDFCRRRRFVNAARIGPLRDYRDQVLAHRMKSEKPVEQDTELNFYSGGRCFVDQTNQSGPFDAVSALEYRL